jgi:hypothetical protein
MLWFQDLLFHKLSGLVLVYLRVEFSRKNLRQVEALKDDIVLIELKTKKRRTITLLAEF